MIYEDYESSSLISISIIVDLTIMLLNATADVIISDGEFVGVGDYACRRGIKHSLNRDVNRSELLDFIMIVESIRRKVEYDNRDLIQD